MYTAERLVGFLIIGYNFFICWFKKELNWPSGRRYVLSISGYFFISGFVIPGTHYINIFCSDNQQQVSVEHNDYGYPGCWPGGFGAKGHEECV